MRVMAQVNRPRWAARLLLSLCCVVFPAKITWAAHSVHTAPIVAEQPTSQFAIADFDGDGHLDIASVQTGQFGPLETKYWIQFQLSSEPRQFILVTAPTGGLQILPRDVNGDNALDLIVTTAGQHRPVAVLLNDGRGNFTLRDPAAFSASLWEARSTWAPAPNRAPEVAAAMPSRNLSGRCPKAQRSFSLARHHIAFFPTACCQPIFALTASILSRAPPSSAVHA